MNKVFCDKKKIFKKQRFKVNDLVVIDINTLIYFKDYIKEKDKNFEILLNRQIKSMNTEVKNTKKNKEEIQAEFWKKIDSKLKPISEQIDNKFLKSKTENFRKEFSVIF